MRSAATERDFQFQRRAWAVAGQSQGLAYGEPRGQRERGSKRGRQLARKRWFKFCQVASIDTQYAADSDYSAEQSDLAQAAYVQAAAFALADENWSDRAATHEQTFAIAEANRADAFEQQQGVDQQTYSEAIASNQQTDDERQAAAQAQNLIDQTTANNAQNLGAATASASFDSAQFAANVLAMNALAANMPSGSTAIGPLPWAQYEVKLAVEQQATWNSQLDAAYLNLQRQTANAETAYAASEAATAIASADQVAEQTYSNSVYAAGRTEQEVVSSAGIEQTFNQNLANAVYTYRTSIAGANYNYTVA
jgi:hypothetical protein